MSSASENSYDESPGIQLPAISIGGNGNDKPAITIGGNDNDEDGAYARPQITIGRDPDNSGYQSNNNDNNYNNAEPSGDSGSGWGDHWDHRRPRIRMKMPDWPQTYIEKNFKLPPIKLKINANPRVKITTGKFLYWFIKKQFLKFCF